LERFFVDSRWCVGCMMYPSLRIASFLQKIIAVVNAGFGVVVYVYVVSNLGAASRLFQAQVGEFFAGTEMLIAVFATLLLINWLIGCVFVYAIGSFIDLMLSVEKSLWILRLNVSQTPQ
jgi:hypothetical protein